MHEYLGLESGLPMFRQDFTCPALLKDNACSTCTGLSPATADLSRSFHFIPHCHWPGPRSLATTCGVSVDVLSCRYLDVSVPCVRFLSLCIQNKIPCNNTWKPFWFLLTPDDRRRALRLRSSASNPSPRKGNEIGAKHRKAKGRRRSFAVPSDPKVQQPK